MESRIAWTNLTISDRVVGVVLLAILAFGVFPVMFGYAVLSFLFGLLVLDGLLVALYAAFKGAVRADVASFAAEVGATTHPSVWPRIAHWLFIGITGIYAFDAIAGGITGRSPPFTAGALASLGILLIVVFVVVDYRAKIR